MARFSRVATVLGWSVLAGCKPDPEPTGPVWSAAFDTDGVGALSGVWGAGPDDVWMVGGQPDQAEIFHFDGSEWSPAEAPAVPLLVWVYGFGPDDVWAVGVGGGVVHWDGAAWTALDSGTTEDLWGVWGEATDDLWIVGGDPNDGDPVVLHSDGASFTPYAAANDRGAHALFKVWGIDGRAWAVGQYGLISEWDGSAWVQQGSGASDDFVSLWGTSADHVLAVGGRSGALLARFDGSTWTSSEPVGLAGLSAVTMPDAGEAIVGGVHGYVGHVDPAAGDPVAEDGVDTVDVHALWSDGAGRVYGVAGHFLDPYFGTALVREEEAP